jgi:hypothetical protein
VRGGEAESVRAIGTKLALLAASVLATGIVEGWPGRRSMFIQIRPVRDPAVGGNSLAAALGRRWAASGWAVSFCRRSVQPAQRLPGGSLETATTPNPAPPIPGCRWWMLRCPQTMFLEQPPVHNRSA